MHLLYVCVCVHAEKRAAKGLEPTQVQLKEQLTVQRSQRLAEVSNMQQHAKAMVVSSAASVQSCCEGLSHHMSTSKVAVCWQLCPACAWCSAGLALPQGGLACLCSRQHPCAEASEAICWSCNTHMPLCVFFCASALRATWCQALLPALSTLPWPSTQTVTRSQRRLMEQRRNLTRSMRRCCCRCGGGIVGVGD